jgi:hypothetical protein
MITLMELMEKPVLTKERIKLAYAIAIIADLLEFPITAAEMTILGAPAGEGATCILDCIVMGAMTKLLGFHWAFVPSFLVETVPGLDLLPTWVGCVAFVVWQRKKEQGQPPPIHAAVVDVQEAEVISVSPAARHTAPPPLLADASEAIPAQAPPVTDGDVDRRLNKLTDLRDRNVITQAEYEAKRQQVLAEI